MPSKTPAKYRASRYNPKLQTISENRATTTNLSNAQRKRLETLYKVYVTLQNESRTPRVRNAAKSLARSVTKSASNTQYKIREMSNARGSRHPEIYDTYNYYR